MTQVIAEIGLQHDGSLRDALAYVRACAKRGVDVVKFQAHQGDGNAKFRPGTEHQFPQDESRFRYWQRTGFTDQQWERVKQECDDCGVEFLCTPFSVVAAEMLNPLVKRWKIGSGQALDKELFAFIRTTGKAPIVSCGMYSVKDVDALWSRYPADYLKCTSTYPNTEADAPLFKGRPYDGISDHSGTIWPSLCAASRGAEIIEVHVCWSKEQGGPDVSSAITIEQLGQLVEGVRYVERMRNISVPKRRSMEAAVGNT